MNYVLAGYAVTVGAIALYAGRVLLRGRALRRVLSPARPADRTDVRAGQPDGGTP